MCIYLKVLLFWANPDQYSQQVATICLKPAILQPSIEKVFNDSSGPHVVSWSLPAPFLQERRFPEGRVVLDS